MSPLLSFSIMTARLSIVTILVFFWLSVSSTTAQSPSRRRPIQISNNGFRTLGHNLRSGPVYVLNEKQIQIRYINYDGQGSAAWFAVGSGGEGYKYRSVDLRRYSNLTFIPDEAQSCDRPRRYNGRHIVLTLPGSMKVTEIRFLVMFDVSTNTNFGYIEIPQDLQIYALPPVGANVPTVNACEVSRTGVGREIIPKPNPNPNPNPPSSARSRSTTPVTISTTGFASYSHDVHSGPITILNEKKIQIQNLNYDGLAPATWFVVGGINNDYTIEKPMNFRNITLIPDEIESCERLPLYDGTKTITLTLPGTMKVSDISFLMLYCFRFHLNLGYVEIPRDLDISSLPPLLDGDFRSVQECQHTEIDEVMSNTVMPTWPPTIRTTLRQRTTTSTTRMPTTTTTTTKTSTTRRPTTTTTTTTTAPEISIVINEKGFTNLAHGLRSGPIRILNEKQIQIRNIRYDGRGPAAWFAVGSGGEDYKIKDFDLRGITLIPDDRGRCGIVRRFDGSQTITLTLPGTMKVTDITFLIMFCIEFNQNFGYVEIPRDLNMTSLPPVQVGRDVPVVKSCASRPLTENSASSLSLPRPTKCQGSFLEGEQDQVRDFLCKTVKEATALLM